MTDKLDLRFIITGHGRSGTLWLARVLNQCDPSVAVHHEPLAQYDARHYAGVYDGTEDAGQFVRRRVSKMRAIWERHPETGYAEVNSYLRYCVPELREAFGVPIVAIVRDGRYVVRSMLARGCYQKPGYPPIDIEASMTFIDSAPIAESHTPFGLCCKYWADTYLRLVHHGVVCYRLEDLNADFGQFRALCNAVGAQADEAVWRRHAGQRANADVGDAPLDWDEEQVAVFRWLAGDVQRLLGYEGG